MATPHNTPDISFSATITQSAFLGSLQEVEFTSSSETADLNSFLSSLRTKLKEKLCELYAIHHGLKFCLIVDVEYVASQDENKTVIGFLHSTYKIMINTFQLIEIIDEIYEQVIERNSNFIREKSGLVIKKIKVLKNYHIFY